MNAPIIYRVEGHELTCGELCKLFPGVSSATMTRRLSKGLRTFALLGESPESAVRRARREGTKRFADSFTRDKLMREDRQAARTAERAAHKTI